MADEKKSETTELNEKIAELQNENQCLIKRLNKKRSDRDRVASYMIALVSIMIGVGSFVYYHVTYTNDKSEENKNVLIAIERERLNLEVELFQAKRDSLNIAYETLKQKYNNLNIAYATLKQKYDNLKKEIERLNKPYYAANDSLVQVIKGLQEKINYLKDEKNKTDNLHVSDKGLINEYKKNLDELQRVYTSQKEQNEKRIDVVTSISSSPESDVTLSGTIVDEENQQPLTNVVVNISDRFGNALWCKPRTDKNGFYSCQIPKEGNQGRAIIRITHNGYKPVEYNAWVGSNRTIDFSLSR
jgi:predicted HTH domain antitoxin